MTETGLLCSAEMVRAYLDGSKTQTRRLRGLKDINVNPDYWGLMSRVGHASFEFINYKTNNCFIIKCPYGGVGDLIYVRETWNIHDLTYDDYNGGWEMGYPLMVIPKEKPLFHHVTLYKADSEDEGPWRPSIHMPKWASRIWLEIVDVRPERLQDITEEDAIAEGIQIMRGTWQRTETNPQTGKLELTGEPQPFTARYHFEALWDSINPGYPWAMSPWVWRIESKRINKEA